MGFFDDLAMGFGAKAPTKDFEARTAATMESNRNPGGAQQYRESRGVTSADIGNTAPSTYQGGGFFGGYTSGADLIDGGGPGRSGARFSSADTGAFAGDPGTYVSEQMYLDAEKNQPEAFAQTQGGIASLSNLAGFRPYGSYDQERGLGAKGINIGTSGIGDYFAGQGAIGNFIRGGVPSSKQRVEPNVPIGNSLDPAAVQFLNEQAGEVPSLMERLRLTPEFANPNPTMIFNSDDSDNSLTPAPPQIEEIIAEQTQPTGRQTFIAPLRRNLGGIVSLGRR